MSNGKSIVKKSSRKGSKTDSSTEHQSSETLTSLSSPVQLKSTKDLSMFLREAFPANHLALLENKKAKKTKGTNGRQPCSVFATFDLDTRSWRTSQVSLILGTSAKSSLRWPKQGTMRDGLCSEQAMWAPHTDARDSGYWPTPTVQDSNKATKRWREDHQNKLTAAVFNPEQAWPTPSANMSECTHPDREVIGLSTVDKNGTRWGASLLDIVHHRTFPTPTSRDWKGGYKTESLTRKDGKSRAMDALPNAILDGKGVETSGGHLSPMWVEWLMGWPIGWTACEPLATVRFQQWQQLHGMFLSNPSEMTNQTQDDK